MSFCKLNKSTSCHREHRQLGTRVCPCAAAYAARVKAGKPVERVILHAGDIHGHDKIEGMERLGCWNASNWTPETGEELIKEVS